MDGTSGSAYGPAESQLQDYILNYLLKRNFPKTAAAFAEEAQLTNSVPIDSQYSFILEWWCVFWEIFNSQHKEPVTPQQTMARSTVTSNALPLPPRQTTPNSGPPSAGQITFVAEEELEKRLSRTEPLPKRSAFKSEPIHTEVTQPGAYSFHDHTDGPVTMNSKRKRSSSATQQPKETKQKMRGGGRAKGATTKSPAQSSPAVSMMQTPQAQSPTPLDHMQQQHDHQQYSFLQHDIGVPLHHFHSAPPVHMAYRRTSGSLAFPLDSGPGSRRGSASYCDATNSLMNNILSGVHQQRHPDSLLTPPPAEDLLRMD